MHSLRAQNHLFACHAERSEESAHRAWRFFAALSMTGSMIALDVKVTLMGQSLSLSLLNLRCRNADGLIIIRDGEGARGLRGIAFGSLARDGQLIGQTIGLAYTDAGGEHGACRHPAAREKCQGLRVELAGEAPAWRAIHRIIDGLAQIGELAGK